LLPQVASPEYGWDAKTFLDYTLREAGLPALCWHQKNTEILTFEGPDLTGVVWGIGLTPEQCNTIRQEDSPAAWK